MDQQSTAELVMKARGLRDGGDPESAIELLREALDVVVNDGDHFLAAFLTHDLGHAEREPEAQLRWHLECLEHIDAVGDERVKGFYGSAHVNLGLTYLRLGKVTRALEHCELGETAIPNLPDNPYGQQMRDGLAKLRQEIAVTAEGTRRDDLNPWGESV